jgi:hypothetical protein
MMNALEDEDVQRKGFVKVVYNVDMGKLPTLDTDLMFKGAPVIFAALPFRMAAMHCCYDDSLIRPAISAMQHAIGRSGRIRFRAHYGTLHYVIWGEEREWQWDFVVPKAGIVVLYGISQSFTSLFVYNRFPFGMPIRFEYLWNSQRVHPHDG